MKAEEYRHIVIEGPIGVGKTSLARRMAKHLNCELLLEKPDENPFLERFYEDMHRYALPTQLFFLFQRADQLKGLVQADMFAHTVVSDFMLEKDPLFAQLTLSDAEYELYLKIFRHLQPKAPPPGLVVYLQAPPGVLIERVKRRGKMFERSISLEYLKRLSEGYTRFFHQYEAAPLMIINSENLNFADSEADFDLLLQQIEKMRGHREYFNRGI
jgi:deoxyadenosine/deoxycytidine kinase